jgi:hypothetical protein
MNFFDQIGSFFGGDSDFNKWNDRRKTDIANQYDTYIGSDQSKMLAQQDFAFDQNTAKMPHAGTDWKGMAKDLGKGMIAFQESQKFTTAKPAQLLQQAQAPQMPQQPIGMAAQAQQPQMSTGMQAIMGNMTPEQRKMGIFGMLGR